MRVAQRLVELGLVPSDALAGVFWGTMEYWLTPCDWGSGRMSWGWCRAMFLVAIMDAFFDIIVAAY